MTLPYRKKLIEVGLPLVAINAESAREKSIRHGHPSTLHLWWARRPLAACRAVLFSSLVDDPDSDPAFHKADGSVDEDRAGIKRADLFNFIEELVMWENSNNADVIRTARAEIARCVASRLIETGAMKKDTGVGPKTTAYDLVKLGHCKPVPMGLDKKVGRVRFSCDVSTLPPADVVNAFLAEHAPPVLDPFAGGGSIPLEAQRLGLRANASDLNPVPVLINKALIEIPPKFAGRPPVNPESRGEGTVTKGKGKKATLFEKEWQGAAGLAEDVRYYGKWMCDHAEKLIGHLYPKVHVTAEMAKDRRDLLPYVDQQLTVIAWLWARTVICPNPACRAQIPLVRSFELSKKPGKRAWIFPVVNDKSREYSFTVKVGSGDAPPSTVQKRAVTCIVCGTTAKLDHVRTEAQAGRMGVIPTTIVAEGSRERVYLPPLISHSEIAASAKPLWKPEQLVTTPCHDVDRLPMYGMFSWGDAFTARQLVALTTFSDSVREVREVIRHEAIASDWPNDSRSLAEGGNGLSAYSDAVATYLAFAVDRSADFWSSLCTWANQPKNELVAHVFGRQALAMVWDFAEASPFSDSSGNFLKNLDFVVKVIESMQMPTLIGTVVQRDATAVIELAQPALVSTDPPYYDNIGYAELSDFFYVWMRRSLAGIFPELFSTLLTPKAQELTASRHRHDGNGEDAKRFFEVGLGNAFSRMRAVQHGDFPLSVYYAFKQTESDDDEDNGEINNTAVTASTGWETMLEGLFRSGFAITGTWPMRTERPTGMKGVINALASSILLVCRPRPANASLATRKEFITALRRELPEALRNLQRGNIAPVDLAQAAIGPGMAVFTRYAKVLESNGSPMTVRTALGLINQALDEVLAEQEGEFDGDTRWALAWFEQFGMDEGPFGDAETLSKAKNTAVNGLVEAGVIKAHGGKVRLLRRDELPADWNPATDKRIAVWEVTQHLIRILDQQGELRAAALVEQLGGMAEIARDLAYRLYSTCERKKWAEEAMAYNGLVIAWPELTKLALAERTRKPSTQQGEFF